MIKNLREIPVGTVFTFPHSLRPFIFVPYAWEVDGLKYVESGVFIELNEKAVYTVSDLLWDELFGITREDNDDYFGVEIDENNLDEINWAGY